MIIHGNPIPISCNFFPHLHLKGKVSLNGQDNVRAWMYVGKGMKRREDSTSGRETEDTSGKL